MRAAIANPQAWDNPSPKGPDEVSRLGIRFIEGCPSNGDPICRNVSNISLEKYPACAIVTYRTGQICPLERMRRSLSLHEGLVASCFNTRKYRAVKISTMPKGPAECPDLAFTNIEIMSWRISFAFFSSSSIEYCFIKKLR